MPVVAMTVLKTLGSVGLSMLMSLLTENFLRKMAIRLLESQDDEDKSDTYSRAVADLREAWNIKD